MGTNIEQATDTFFLATDDKFSNIGNLPKYYSDL